MYKLWEIRTRASKKQPVNSVHSPKPKSPKENNVKSPVNSNTPMSRTGSRYDKSPKGRSNSVTSLDQQKSPRQQATPTGSRNPSVMSLKNEEKNDDTADVENDDKADKVSW